MWAEADIIMLKAVRTAELLNLLFLFYKVFLCCLFCLVLSAAEHWWTFDDTTSLYSIIDKITETRASIRQGGAKLTRHESSRNNFLTLEGRSSSIELGRFGKCIGDLTACTSGFTFSLWLRLRDTEGEDQYILGSRDILGNEQGFSLLRTKHNKMKVVLRDSRSEMHISYSSSSGIWSHHLVVWDGQAFSIYVNGGKLVMEENRQRIGRHGFEKEELENSLKEKKTIETGLFSLGRHGFKIDADYDDVMFWNRSLNRTEAIVMYYRDLGLFLFLHFTLFLLRTF